MEEEKNVGLMLEDAIATRFKNLALTMPGSEEEATQVEDVVKLYKVRLEEAKADSEYDEAVKSRELELEKLALEKAKNDIIREDNRNRLEIEKAKLAAEEARAVAEAENAKTDRYWRYGTHIGLGLLQLVFATVAHRDNLRFEETGTFTSRALQKADSVMKTFFRK